MRRLLLFIATLFSLVLAAQDNGPKTLMFYTGGMYTPFGMRMAMQGNEGWGLFLEGRCNASALKANEFTISNGRINDAAWTWSYAGKKRYGRAEIYAGMLFPVLPKQNPFEFSGKVDITMWAGAGILFARYLYLYDRQYQRQIDEPVWIRDLDRGGVGFDLEGGIQVRRGRKYFFLGCSGLMYETERMIVGGIGYKYGM